MLLLSARHALLANARSELAASRLVTHCSLTLAANLLIIIFLKVLKLCFFLLPPARHALLANARSELGASWLSFLTARHALLADARSELAGSWLVTHCSLTLAAKEKIIVVFVLCLFFLCGLFPFFFSVGK